MAETQWNKLGAYLKETQILGSIQNTLYWDQNTGMPKKGTKILKSDFSLASCQLSYPLDFALAKDSTNLGSRFFSLFNSLIKRLIFLSLSLIKS